MTNVEIEIEQFFHRHVSKVNLEYHSGSTDSKISIANPRRAYRAFPRFEFRRGDFSKSRDDVRAENSRLKNY